VIFVYIFRQQSLRCFTVLFNLFSNIPQFYVLDKSNAARTLSKFLCSLSVPTIVSFELDDDCVLTNIFNDDGLLFPESIHLTDIRITLFQFEHCICLLNQFGSQLCSFVVNMMFVTVSWYFF
jgi:hypothetical protein